MVWGYADDLQARHCGAACLSASRRGQLDAVGVAGGVQRGREGRGDQVRCRRVWREPRTMSSTAAARSSASPPTAGGLGRPAPDAPPGTSRSEPVYKGTAVARQPAWVSVRRLWYPSVSENADEVHSLLECKNHCRECACQCSKSWPLPPSDARVGNGASQNGSVPSREGEVLPGNFPSLGVVYRGAASEAVYTRLEEEKPF